MKDFTPSYTTRSACAFTPTCSLLFVVTAWLLRSGSSSQCLNYFIHGVKMYFLFPSDQNPTADCRGVYILKLLAKPNVFIDAGPSTLFGKTMFYSKRWKFHLYSHGDRLMRPCTTSFIFPSHSSSKAGYFLFYSYCPAATLSRCLSRRGLPFPYVHIVCL